MIPLYDHNPTHSTPLVTLALIAINAVVMFYLATLPPIALQEAAIKHGFIPARMTQLRSNKKLEVPVTKVVLERDRFGKDVAKLRDVGKVDLPPSRGQILGTVLTTMFMHGGWLHLIGNMWFLWIFGNNVEDRLGHVLYLVYYLVGGVLATACHWAYDPTSLTPVVGASGAVAAVLGGYAVTWPRAKVTTLVFLGILFTIEFPALAWLGLWFGGQLLDASFNRDLGVAVWAHIGGFVAGAIAMPMLTFGSTPPGESAHDEFERLLTSFRPDEPR